MSSAPDTRTPRIALSRIIDASARLVQGVREGRSLTDGLAHTAPELRAATQAVTFHVMRRYGRAEQIRQILVRRTPPNALFDAVLLVAIALLDTAHEVVDNPRLPEQHRGLPVYAPHTIVDQAVRLVSGRRAWQAYKGLLNGTLRALGREHTEIVARALRNPVARFNHPQWWIDQLAGAYPDCWQQLLLEANQPGPLTLRVNVRRKTVQQLHDILAAAGIDSQEVGKAGLALMQPRPVHDIPGFDEGWWSVQDASAQLAAGLLGPRDGERVLDACAAPGGKSAHLLETAQIELTALDSDARRLEKIVQTLQRLGLHGDHVTLKCADAAQLDEWWDGRQFDAVLADVPCTASGVVRRHPDIRWLRRESDLAQTARLQQKIVDALWQTVRPGGRMLYATCSVFPAEGEHQATRFSSVHADAVRLPAPGQILPLDTPQTGRLYDGFFYAQFVKQG